MAYDKLPDRHYTSFSLGYEDGTNGAENNNIYVEFTDDWYRYNRGYDRGYNDFLAEYYEDEDFEEYDDD
jgi:hypothetical protein